MIAYDSRSQNVGMDFLFPPIPEFWNFFSLPSRSRILVIVFFHSLPVPYLWEWNYPFPFPNTQKSFSLIPEWYCQVLISTLNVKMVPRRPLQIKRLFRQPSQKEEVTRNWCNASRGPQCCCRNVTSIWSILDCKVQKMVEYMLPHQIPPGHWLVVGLIKTLWTKLPDRVEAQKGDKGQMGAQCPQCVGCNGCDEHYLSAQSWDVSRGHPGAIR